MALSICQNVQNRSTQRVRQCKLQTLVNNNVLYWFNEYNALRQDAKYRGNYEQGRGKYGSSLYYLLHFSVNLKLP